MSAVTTVGPTEKLSVHEPLLSQIEIAQRLDVGGCAIATSKAEVIISYV
jgi:hypothetical protein